MKKTLKAVSNQQGIFIFLIAAYGGLNQLAKVLPTMTSRGCNGPSEFPGSAEVHRILDYHWLKVRFKYQLCNFLLRQLPWEDESHCC